MSERYGDRERKKMRKIERGEMSERQKEKKAETMNIKKRGERERWHVYQEFR